MAYDRDLVRAIRQDIETKNHILVVSHIRPDGDAIGSLLGFGLALQAFGKEVDMVMAEGVPANFHFLEGYDQVQTRPRGLYDWVCVLDCSDLERVGHVLDDLGTPDLNVDHHPTNLDFARLNLVDTHAVATAEIIAGLLPEFNLPVTLPAANALLTGLITDTIGFRTSNMTPEALRLAADLMEMGANLPDIYHQALVGRSFEAIRFWGAGLSKVQCDGRMVWTSLSLEERATANYPGRDDADLVNVLSAVEGADVALIFVEQPHGSVKVSWRSRPGFDVSQIALSFGGGGHAAASGAELKGNLTEVQAAVLEATRPLIK
jgi:phosphoesterase RecJ-like protein